MSARVGWLVDSLASGPHFCCPQLVEELIRPCEAASIIRAGLETRGSHGEAIGVALEGISEELMPVVW